jgi:hypothetical protein
MGTVVPNKALVCVVLILMVTVALARYARHRVVAASLYRSLVTEASQHRDWVSEDNAFLMAVFAFLDTVTDKTEVRIILCVQEPCRHWDRGLYTGKEVSEVLCAQHSSWEHPEPTTTVLRSHVPTTYCCLSMSHGNFSDCSITEIITTSYALHECPHSEDVLACCNSCHAGDC